MFVGSVENRNRVSRGRVGFTLVELLVSMTIIAVLAAITFPMFAKAKEAARTSECLSNMREIGAALHMYLDEYDARFPAAVPWGSPSYWAKPENGNQSTIQELLNAYVRNGMIADESGMYTRPGVFACPSDTGIPLNDFKTLCGVPVGKTVWTYTGCSYEYYASDQEDWLDWGNRKPVPWTALSPEIEPGKRTGAPLSAIMYSTKKAVMGDVWFWHMGDQVLDGRLGYRNTLFADGHAERVKGIYHLEARLQQLQRWHSASDDYQ